MAIKNHLYSKLVLATTALLTCAPLQVFAEEGSYAGFGFESGTLKPSLPSEISGVTGYDGNTSLTEYVSTLFNSGKALVQFILVIAIIAAVGYTIYAGWLYASSTGNPQKRDVATQQLKTSVIGAAAVGGFSIIVNVALGFFGQ